MRVKAKFPTLSERNQALKAPAITWAFAAQKPRPPPANREIPSRIYPARQSSASCRNPSPCDGADQQNACWRQTASPAPCDQARPVARRLALDGNHRSLEITERQQAGHISVFSSTIFFITFSIELNLLDESIEQQPSRDAGCSPPDSCPLTHCTLKNKNRTY